jgi:hypothetical protein
MVIYGGSGPSQTSDVWALDLGTNHWDLIDPGFSGPGGRMNHAAVYDVLHDRMVMYGGGPDGSVWALPFSGSTAWTQLACTGPPPRMRQAMGAVYDATTNVMIMFGGQAASFDTMLNESVALQLRGNPNWMPLDFGSELPPPRQGHVVAFDQVSATLYVTGGCCEGLVDTWAASFDRTTPAQASLVSASAQPGRVEITWWVPRGTGAVTIQRSNGAGWSVAAVRDPDGAGLLAYQDSDVAAGHRYGYRLLIRSTDGVNPASEVWLDVPTELNFALGGFLPNPAAGIAQVTFKLGSSAPARLQVLDVAGRSVLTRDVGMLGPGVHVVPVRGASAGVYLLRLTQNGQVLTRKATLLP